MKEAVIYLGCSYPQMLGIKTLHQAGFAVIGCDIKRLDTDTKFLTEFHRISATDVSSLVALTKDLKKRYHILFAYGVADFCYEAVAAIHKELDDPALPKEYSHFVSKILSKHIFKTANVPHPYLICKGTNPENLLSNWKLTNYAGPSVLKIDARNNSSGVFLIQKTNSKAILKAVQNSNYNRGHILLEQQVLNYQRIINVDAIVIDGSFIPLVITSRIIDDIDKRQNLALVQPAIDIAEQDKQKLFGYVRAIVDSISYKFGAITIDFIEQEPGKFIALEMSPHFHLIRSTIWLLGWSPLVRLAEKRSKNPLTTIYSFKKISSHIVCYHLVCDYQLQVIIVKDLITDLIKKGEVLDGYAMFPRAIGTKYYVGIIWKVVSEKKQIRDFKKKLNTMLKSLAFKSKNA